MSHGRTAFRSVGATALVVLAALTALFAGSWDAASPLATVDAESSEEATIRVSAKRLANEQTEFGLQVYSEGEWSADRTLPRLRRLSPNAEVDRWYRSSSIELDSGQLVRIVARLLETGQFEVGLQEIVDGEDSERRFPQTRLFPRSPTVNQWLNTSPLVLANPNPEPPYTPLVGAKGREGSDIEFASWYNNDGVHTWVRSGAIGSKAVDTGEEAHATRLYLIQACVNSQDRSLRIEGLSGARRGHDRHV